MVQVKSVTHIKGREEGGRKRKMREYFVAWKLDNLTLEIAVI